MFGPLWELDHQNQPGFGAFEGLLGAKAFGKKAVNPQQTQPKISTRAYSRIRLYKVVVANF